MTTTNWTGVETGVGVAGGSARGARRDHNEDAFGAQQPRDAREATERGSLFVVADGVGGRNGGEVASSLAVDFLLDEYFAHPGADPLEALEAACLLANAEIVDRAAGDPNLNGMATTLVAAAVRDLDLFVAHVGDSRVYRLRGRRLERLTADHTLTAEAPGLDGTAGQDSAPGGRITRFLGSPAGVRPELQHHRLEPGDVLMLCSDGLTDAISEPELASTLRSRSPDEAVRRLLVRSREQGARDDHTVVVARIPAAERAVLSAPRMPAPGREAEESVPAETRRARRSVTPTELIPVATPAADTVATEPMAADEAANSLVFPERASRFEQRPSRLRPAWQAPVRKWLVVPVVLLVALVAGLQIMYAGRAVPGVTIAGAPVGGLSKADLERVVNERFTEYSASRIVLQVPNKQWRYTPAELGWRRDVAGTVEAALTIGHSANPVARLREQVDAFVFGREISPAASVDESRLAAVARSLAAEIDQPARDATLVLDPDLRLRVEASQSERKLDQAAAARDIRQQLAQLRP
ncbi:MAG: protein phosphatase 2C domain-containing protein, partial [Chloroflexi bacterium]|nr:protein phosphatase 2C domain-containing protein [Chloroflexota bacterium]